MLFKQFVDDDLGCGSYLVGDEQAGVAVVVDPAYAIEPYLDECKRRGVELVARARDAHARRPRLRSRPPRARARICPCTCTQPPKRRSRTSRSQDGTELELGEVVIRTIHTPGHRPEHCAFAVIDRSRGDEPWLVLTGDSLFVGDAARPDLAIEALDGAEGLFHSLRRLVELGDGVEVYPGSRRRLALRRGDELEGVDDDRLRAALQSCARRDARRVPREAPQGRSRRARRTWRRSSS